MIFLLKRTYRTRFIISNTLDKLNRVRLNSTQSEPPKIKRLDKAMDKGKTRLFELMSIYEEAIGLKEIKQAQQSVLDVCFKNVFSKLNL